MVGKSNDDASACGLNCPCASQCEGANEEWTAVSRVLDLAPFGARFSLARLVDRGRLVHLTLPMPRQLRCFDHAEDQYRVWALVRNVLVTTPDAKTELPRFELGVAFVGK